MQNYQHLNIESLLDLLAGLTRKYTHAIISGANKHELQGLRESVTCIQKELGFRRNNFERYGKTGKIDDR